MHHVLGQHVHVRHVDGPDRAGRFPVSAADRRAPRRSAREAARQASGTLLVLPNGVQRNQVAAAATGEAAGYPRRVRGAATVAEVEECCAGAGCRRFLVLVGLPDQGVDQHDAPAAELLFLALPARSAGASVAAARASCSEGEVLEERDVVVLPADGACGNRKLGVSFVGPGRTAVPGRAVVLGREPQPRAVVFLREGHDRPGDAADESVHHGPQQRPTVASRRRSERQPGQDLGLGHRPPDPRLEGGRQLLQGLRGRQLFIQPEHDLVAGERRVQRLGPIARAQFFSRQRAVDRARLWPGRDVVLHGSHGAVEDLGGVRGGSRRGESRRRPDIGLVVLPDRRDRVGRHAEETRREVAPRLRVVVIDDGRRGRDARRTGRVGPTERAETSNETGRLRPQRARERMRFVEHQEIEPGAGEQLDVLLPRQQQLELLDVGEQNPRLPPGAAHDVARADLFGRIDRLAAAVSPRPFQSAFVVGPRRTRGQLDPGYSRFVLRRFPDIHAEGNPGTRQQPAQSHELVFRQGVHRIDDDGADARRGVVVPQAQAPADEGVEEALGLARSGAGGDQGRSTLGDRAQGAFLVAVQVGEPLGDPFAQMRMQQSLADQATTTVWVPTYSPSGTGSPSSRSIATTSLRFSLSSSMVSPWLCAPGNPGTYPT